MTRLVSRYDFLIKSALLGAALTAAPLLPEAQDVAFAAEGADAPTRGGTIKVGVGETIQVIDPTKPESTLERFDDLIAPQYYETPVKYGKNGKLIPLLAESWDNSNPKETVLHIRPGVEFHNGKTVTADDWVYSIRLANSPTMPPAVPPNIWGSVSKIDKNRVLVKTKIPYRLMDNVRYWWIIPNDTTINYTTAPVGTGAFKFKSFVKGSSLDLVRNPNYWGAPKPYLDGLSFVFLPSVSAQIANFLSGTVDYLHDVPINLMHTVSGKRGSKAISSGYFFHWWHPQMLRGPLRDVKARQALRYAMNRKQMDAVAWGGLAPMTINAYDVTPYKINENFNVPYDPAHAARLLSKTAAKGATIPLNVIASSDQGKLEAQVMQQGFRKAGLNAPINIQEPSLWVKQLYADGTFQGLSDNYGTIPFPYDGVAHAMLFPTIPPRPPHASPIPKLYHALIAAESTVPEPAYRQAILNVQRVMLEEAAVYLSFVAPNHQIIPGNLKGLQVTNLGDVFFTGAHF